MNSRRESLKKRREPLQSTSEALSGETQLGIPVTRQIKVINNSIIPSFPTTHATLSRSDLSSINIQEIRKRPKPPDEASTKRYKTSSIQINQASYPQPPVGEQSISIRTCPWCARILCNTLSESEWRQHVDQDFEPYICLSEKCPESHPAYPTFDGWFKHMRLHNQRWNEQFYLTSSWVCTVCDANAEVYSSPHALHCHMKRSHSNNFTSEQLEIISRQSKLDQSRAGLDCLLCCFVVEEQEFPDSVVFPKRLRGKVKQETVEAARAAFRMTNPDPHSRNCSDTSSGSDDMGASHDQSNQNEDRSAAVSRHIAAHLQTLMFLTLRFADVQNYNGSLDDDTRSDSVEIDGGNGSSEPNDVARLSDVASDPDIIMKDTTGNVDGTESPTDIDDPTNDGILIPDTDLDISDIPRQYDDHSPENDDFLMRLIESGAYQSSRISPFPFTQPGKSKLLETGLKRHAKRDTKAPAHPCPHCPQHQGPKAFYRAANLATHMRRMHSSHPPAEAEPYEQAPTNKKSH
ncbi:hypothetical protein F4782DRAFT_536134 [Xylaria castorea]|nr:hypothetical protein F4782DRAFT_536134 [Xylaria castorea]